MIYTYNAQSVCVQLTRSNIFEMKAMIALKAMKAVTAMKSQKGKKTKKVFLAFPGARRLRRSVPPPTHKAINYAINDGVAFKHTI